MFFGPTEANSLAIIQDAHSDRPEVSRGGLIGFLRSNPRQIIKLVVYSLLLVNFVHYIGNDIEIARHTWHAGWRLKDWTSAFATTLDESAWFLLLLLLELETYLLSDEAFTRSRVKLLQGLRILCYLAIGHTVFAYGDYLVDLSRAVEHVGVSLCSFADSGLSFARNLEYRELDAINCQTLSTDTTFFQFAQGQAISDTAGMRIEWQLAWVDLMEVVVWLLILLMIEVMVRQQEKGISDSPALRFARVSKFLLYGTLWGAAAYWGYRGHWLFSWDEALWILGFMAIGMNLSEWRKELEGADEAGVTPPSASG
jgi:hypothetical protein